MITKYFSKYDTQKFLTQHNFSYSYGTEYMLYFWYEESSARQHEDTSCCVALWKIKPKTNEKDSIDSNAIGMSEDSLG